MTRSWQAAADGEGAVPQTMRRDLYAGGEWNLLWRCLKIQCEDLRDKCEVMKGWKRKIRKER